MQVDDINEETLSMDQTESEMQKSDSKKEDGKHCPDCGTVFRTPFDLVLHMKEWCPAAYPSSRKRRRVEVEEEERRKKKKKSPKITDSNLSWKLFMRNWLLRRRRRRGGCSRPVYAQQAV